MSNYTDGLPGIFRSSVKDLYGIVEEGKKAGAEGVIGGLIASSNTPVQKFIRGDYAGAIAPSLLELVKGSLAGRSPIETGARAFQQTFMPSVSQATDVSSPAEPALEPAAPTQEPTGTIPPPLPPLATGGDQTAPGFDPQNTTTQLGGLASVLKDYVGGQQGYLDKITSQPYLEAQSALRQRELANATRLIADAQMGQMKEKTRRDTINAWRQITSDQIRAQTALAQGLMEASYRSATPNAATIQALAPLSQQAMSVFKPGTSVI